MFEDELIGTTVDGRYRIDRLVGQGGFGTVYAAWHLRLGAQVALKIPRVDQAPPSEVPELIKTFLDEGRMLKELRHPNIVAALDVGVLPADASGLSLPYLVLEWCQGASLKEWLAAHPGARSREETWALMRPVFDAIAYAHTRGLAHRDIKPANVLLEPTDGALTAKVIDFGIAKRVDPGDDKPSGHTFTTANRNAFTPRYAAPEQLAGLRTGPWSDVYALALVVLEVLAGRAVFSDDGEARARLLQGEALSLDALGFNVGDWNAPLTRALARSPADRFQDATELLRALDAAATAPTVRFTKAETAPPTGETSADLSVAPASHTIRKRLAPSIGRRPGIVAVLSAVLAVGALVIGYFALLRPPSKPPVVASPKLGSDPKPTTSVAGSSSPRPALSSLTADVLAAEAAQAGFVGCVKTSGAEVASLTCADLDANLKKRGNADTDPRAIEAELQSDGLARTAVNGRAYRYLRDGYWSLAIDGDPSRIEGLERSLAAAFAHESSGREKVYSEPPPPVPARLADWRGGEVGARLHALGIRLIADVAEDATSSPVLAATVSGLDGNDAVTALLYRSAGKAMLAAIQASSAKHYAYALDGDVLLTVTSPSKLGRVDFMKKMLDGSRAETVGEVP